MNTFSASKFDCAPPSGIILPVPSRYDLIPYFEELRQTVVGTIMPLDIMIEYLGNYIGSRFNVDVLHTDNPYVDMGSIEISAEYDGLADEEGQTCIKIILVTNILDKTYLWDQEKADRFIVEAIDSLCHELAHMKQARQRNFIDVSWDYVSYNDEKLEAKYYLSHPDEIDAYSYNIASEVQAIMEKKNLLNAVSTCTISDSINLWTYLNTFNYDYNNQILKKLLKKIYILCQNSVKKH